MDEYVNLFKENIQTVSYALLIFDVLIGLAVFFGYCYRESTRDKTFDRAEKRRLLSDVEKS